MNFLISKILPLFFLPFGFGLLLFFLGIIFKKKKFLKISFLILYIFSLGIVSESLLIYIEKPYERLSYRDAKNSQAIVVLSGSLHPSPGKNKIIEWQDPDRFLAGIELFEKNKAPIIIFTEGMDPYKPKMIGEGTFYAKKAMSLGIPKTSIRNSQKVTNTFEEAKEVKKILRSINNDFNEILLVTSAFHMKRAKKVFERQGIKVNSFPVDFKSQGSWSGTITKDPRKWIPDSHNLYMSSKVIREIIGRLVYKSF